MLHLLALACLLAAATAQRSYFCDTSPTSTIRDGDFYLTTRSSSSETGYQAALTCEFNAESSSGAFFVEIESFLVNTAVVTISSGGITLFRGSSLPSHQSTISTPARSLQVRFDSSGDFSRSSGVKMRVRVFDLNGCPPGWVYMYDNCYGTSSTSGRLSYVSAQSACNYMRSNLLYVPTGRVTSIGSFVRLLPYQFRSSYTWIGLTDRTSSGQYRHYWLNGDRQYLTSEISCTSGGDYSTCLFSERCGAINDISNYKAVYMGSCTTSFNFACSMPPGGTNLYYRVPDDGSIIVIPSTYVGISAWVWGVVAASVFVVGMIIAGVYSAARRNVLRNAGNPGSANVVVSTGRVTVQTQSAAIPAPRPPYPQNPPYPQQYPQQYPQYTMGQQSAAPPAYNSAVAGGYGNPGFQGK